MKKYILSVMMLSFLFLQAQSFGSNDTLSIYLILVTTLILYVVVFQLQHISRKAVKDIANEGGWLHGYLDKKTVLTQIISFMLSLFFAIGLIIILKGITLNHGIIAFFILIALVSFIISIFMSQLKLKIIKEELNENTANNVNQFVMIFILAFTLNFILSILLSAHDVMVFLNNNITFNNFDVIALEHAIPKTEHNSISRPIMNLYIILDTFKIAVVGQFIDVFLNPEDKTKYFYLFYVVVFIFNMIKLFAFSMSFILLQRGLEGLVDKIENIESIQKYIGKDKKDIETIKVTEVDNEK